MEETTIARLRDWVEPAHPGVIKLHDDLFTIYTLLRRQYQGAIDSAFDSVSRQIGFVVTTTLPVVLDVGEKGVRSISVGAEHLKGTIFEREFLEALNPLVSGKPQPDPWVPEGTYSLYLIWFAALKLKLRTDWMEPAHFFRGGLITPTRVESATRVRPEVMEPAHWFDPGRAIAVDEAALISVIDEVYPELRLVDRVAAYRQAARRAVLPEVMEPAHFRQFGQVRPEVREPAHLSQFGQVRPEVMEPAHFRPESREGLLKMIHNLLERI